MRAGSRWSRVVGGSAALLTIVAVAACASRRAPPSRQDDLDRTTLVRGQACDRSDQDTTRYLHLPLYRSCAVTVAAQRIPSDLRPEFVPTGRDRSCFSALIEVPVDTLGRPELRAARLVRTSDPGFGAAVLAIVPGLRFEPARLGDRRVRQIFELREVLRVRRGGGLERAGGQRQVLSGARGGMPMGSGGTTPNAPSGVELPAPSAGGVC